MFEDLLTSHKTDLIFCAYRQKIELLKSVLGLLLIYAPILTYTTNVVIKIIALYSIIKS